MRKLLTYIGGICLFFSCEEQQVLEYKNEPGLQFYYGNIPGQSPQKDSLNCSFFILPDSKTRDTMWLRIETTGFPTDYDRQIKLVQLPEEGQHNAQAGTHYVPFDAPELQPLMVIKKEQIQADVPIVFLKDATLDKQEYRLKISIAPNESFGHGITKYQTFLIKVSNIAQQPETWSEWKYYFGTWGPVKMKFLIQYVGIDFSERYPDYMYSYYEAVGQEKLTEYKNNPKNPPLVEADGTEVNF